MAIKRELRVSIVGTNEPLKHGNSVVSLESGLLCKPLWALGASNGCSSIIKGWEFLYFRPFVST